MLKPNAAEPARQLGETNREQRYAKILATNAQVGSVGVELDRTAILDANRFVAGAAAGKAARRKVGGGARSSFYGDARCRSHDCRTGHIDTRTTLHLVVPVPP
ncbi:MAG: hypothetical protein U5L46_07950 [Agrobacterium sp.]|nr:hypothetical protein [Agrobacterium sp.]